MNDNNAYEVNLARACLVKAIDDLRSAEGHVTQIKNAKGATARSWARIRIPWLIHAIMTVFDSLSAWLDVEPE